MDFSVLAELWVILNVRKKRDQYLDLAKELKKKTMDHESDGDTNIICARGTVTKELVEGLEDMEIKGRVETIQATYSIAVIGDITEKLPGVLSRLVGVTQTREKDHQLTLVCHTFKRENIIIMVIIQNVSTSREKMAEVG